MARKKAVVTKTRVQKEKGKTEETTNTGSIGVGEFRDQEKRIETYLKGYEGDKNSEHYKQVVRGGNALKQHIARISK